MDKHEVADEIAEATGPEVVSVEKDANNGHSQAIDNVVAKEEEGSGDASEEKSDVAEATDAEATDATNPDVEEKQEHESGDASGEEEKAVVDDEPEHSKAEDEGTDPKEEKEAKVPTGDDAMEDAEEEEADEDQPLGLLDQPLVIEGKRQRSSVQRLSTTLATPSPSKKTDYKGGKGVELSSVDFIAAQLDKHKVPEFKNMHRVLFGVPGKANTMKRDIRKFNGFDFEKDSTEYKKRHAMLMKLTTADSKFIKTVLGLTLHGDHKKEALVDALMSFLMSPEDQHKKVPSNKRKASTSKKGTSPKKAKKSNAASSKVDESASESAASGDDSDGDEQINEDNEKEEKPDASEKTETLNAETRDNEIENTIRGMLNLLDLTVISLKEMVTMVLKKFPEDNLTERTDWVKATIKKILKEQP